MATAAWLDAIYGQYHRPEYRGTDPIDTLAPYDDPADREIVGLIAASLAYGNVKAILRGIGHVLDRTNPSPAAHLRETSATSITRGFSDFRYRITSGEEMAGLLIGVKRIAEVHGSLNACFVSHVKTDHGDVLPALAGFVDDLCTASGRDLYHLLPHPSRGSACKRLMLYLRWMVRRDAIDPGGWTGVSPAQLIVPLDTHLHRMALRLRLTKRKQPNLRTALEITQSLRRFAPDDPLKYDFALTRPGILGLTRKTP